MLVSVSVFELLKNQYICTPEGIQIGLAPTNDQVHRSQIENNSKGVKNTNASSRIIWSIASIMTLFLVFSINPDHWVNSHVALFKNADWIGSIIFAISIIMPIFIITDKSLTKIERSRIFVIYIIAFFVIFFWAAFEQAGASLTFFVDEQTDRHLWGWELPASSFQSFNAIFVVAFAPIFAGLWSLLGKRGIEPSSPSKQAIGLFLLAVGYLIIAIGVRDIAPNTKVSMIWITSLYLLHTMGELCLSPIGLSMVNKLAPVRFASLLMGVWFMSNAAANKFAGTLSALYPENGKAKSLFGFQISTLYDFFMIFVIMSGIAALILFVLSKWLQKLMGERV
jgi:POT family proton-dependent oligopeptide transporter